MFSISVKLTGGEEAGVRSPLPDEDSDRFPAPWATALVGGVLFVDVNALVDATAFEGNAEERPTFLLAIRVAA